jgi:aryl-alcohol dehydrogenase-like predicted oxidoreductase
LAVVIVVIFIARWDAVTSVEEVMRGLNTLVMAGKVLYLGVSDTPAWVVVKANDYARQHGLTPFSLYQGRWSASFRDLEAEIVPMCRDQGMAICPWGPLSQGNLSSKEQRENKKGGRQRGGPSENDIKVSDKLEEIASTKSTTVQAVVSSTIDDFGGSSRVDDFSRLWHIYFTKHHMSSRSSVLARSSI